MYVFYVLKVPVLVASPYGQPIETSSEIFNLHSIDYGLVWDK